MGLITVGRYATIRDTSDVVRKGAIWRGTIMG